MFNIISLQELKRIGVAKLTQKLKIKPDILLQERGKDACMLVDLDYYIRLKSCELEVLLVKVRKDIAKGKYTIGVKSHIKQMENYLTKIKPE